MSVSGVNSDIVDLTQENDSKTSPNTNQRKQIEKWKSEIYKKRNQRKLDNESIELSQGIKTELMGSASINNVYKNSLKYRGKHAKKKYLAPENIKSKKTSKITGIIFNVSVCILIVICIYCLLKIKCCDKPDPVILKNLLNENVFGQNKAVELIVSVLKNDESKLLIIYGGTGVGKTYAVSLIFYNNFNSSNVFYYAMPTSKETLISNTHWGSLVCSSVIFIFDGLGTNDFDIVKKIESIFAISATQTVTVILIYNCDEVNSYFKKACNDTFRLKLIDEFSAVNVAHKEFIKFKSLTEAHLHQCIDKALDGFILEEQQYQNLLNNFNVDMDGCKGVQSKVQLFKQSI